jgi:hypothetical protein
MILTRWFRCGRERAMRVTVDMEIETPDYGGDEFKKEIEKLIENIRLQAGDAEGTIKLTKFQMRSKYGMPDKERDIDWREDTKTVKVA